MPNTPTITSETMTIDQIEISPLNVRRHRAVIERTEAMELSILGRGLIQPLNVHPMLAGKKFGAFAGGRRTRAIRALVKRGELPVDWPVRVEVYRGYSDIAIIELSLNENMQRADLELYEICAGIRALDARGETVDAIAAALGQELALVRRWHRVGLLAEPIFEAFSQGLLGLGKTNSDVAQAYGATSDQALQLAVFQQMKGLPEWQRTPDKIRAAMKIGDHQASKLLRLVGADGYRAAGGRFELDLFAGDAEERGRVVDEGLLKQLAEDRLAAIRDETRASTWNRDLRFVVAPPAGMGGAPDYTLEYRPKLLEGRPVIPETGVVASIDVSTPGEPKVTYWWESRKAKFGDKTEPKPKVNLSGAQAARDPYTYAAPAKAQAKEEHGVTSDALECMMSIRRELLRALVVEDAHRGGEVGRHYATWAMLRVALAQDSSAEVGARGIAQGAMIGAFDLAEKAKDQVGQHVAHDVWLGAVRDISAESFITGKDRAAAFVDYLNASESTKRLAGAVVAGLALERSANVPGYQMSPHDALALFARGTDEQLRKLWSPTGEFLGMLPKPQQLAIAETIVDAGHLSKWEKVKAAELPALLAQALAGGGNAVPPRHRAAAAAWVHPLLHFEQLDFSRIEPSAELAEAAE
ncbi:ParB/RepB/Spo0J family partition protein [Sphingomonas bacterium]|uniref:ParB/RepB/Spo0J family partition protein n=1 Tax=Sphingomonas bacterium TaxID=1895847 RepID=UPI0015756B14|nr:ParB/RepB/Spo0J family partition protein [Sphingomonas bacterium]